ncbi:DUF6157 family protein [Ravibacter arvi]|uniref:DUF6157 family protein n=1 Tax=Ravibacter arvi TaxID=2051041 RepID=A0ABP8M9I8_9BACT
MMKDKIHTTNYTDTLIEVAEDYGATFAKMPMPRGSKKTIAEQQFELLINHPYEFTSDDVLFWVFAERNELEKTAYHEAREEFFSKGQPCFRASPLTKSHGFGVHANHEGKIAIYPLESEEYRALANDPAVQKVKAMRTSKK